MDEQFLPLIFLNKMKVITTNNDGPDHLGTVASARNLTTPDGNISSKWAFLINVCPCKVKTAHLVT